MSTRGKKRIYLVDPCETIRSGFHSSCPPHIRLGVFDDVLQCLNTIPDNPCELLIVDVALLDIDGKDHLATIRQKHPFLPIIGLGQSVNIPFVVRVLKKGLSDFVEKPVVYSALYSKVMEYLDDNNGPNRQVKLTPSEKKIFHQVLKGKTNKEMATMMQKSIRTIEDHRSNLMKKIGVTNLVDLVKWGIAYSKSDLLKIFSCIAIWENTVSFI
jgi:two-component system response regulator FixJ